MIGELIAGATFILIIQLYQIIRYKIPCQDEEFQYLLHNAATKIGYSDEVEVWSYESTKPIFVHFATVLSNVIVISTSACTDMLTRPEEGEAILADALLDLEQNRRSRIWIPLSLYIGPIILMLWWFITPVPVKMIFLLVIVGVSIPCTFIREVRPTIQQKTNPVMEIYGIHPDAAKIHVFRGAPPTSTEEKNIRKDEDDQQSTPRSTLLVLLVISSSVLLALVVALIVTQLIVVTLPSIIDLIGSRDLFMLIIFGISLVIVFNVVTRCSFYNKSSQQDVGCSE